MPAGCSWITDEGLSVGSMRVRPCLVGGGNLQARVVYILEAWDTSGYDVAWP